MPGTNDFQPFSTGGGANVITQATYVALTTLIANGFQSGTAESAKVNKVLRQSTFGVAALAQLMTDVLQANVQDDGVVANFEAQLADVMRGRVRYADDTGAANAYAIAPAPATTAYAKGQEFTFKAANSNTGSSTLNVNGLGAKSVTRADGSALGAGDIISGQMVTVRYDGTAFQLAGLAGFTFSLASNGYQRLPSGLIMQWGASSTSGSADVAVTFPIAFPTAIYSLSATGTSVFAATPGYVVTNTPTSTGFNAGGYNNGGTRQAFNFNWIALGK